MTAQGKAARYVCVGCGTEGLLHEDEARGGRARCPHCGRAIDIEIEAAEGAAGTSRGSDAEARLLPAG